MSTAEVIDKHARAIADLIRNEAAAALARIAAAQEEALERVEQLTPADYDYAAASRYLGIPRRTLERRVRAHKISFRKDGQRVLFTRTALDEYKLQLTTNARPLKPLSL